MSTLVRISCYLLLSLLVVDDAAAQCRMCTEIQGVWFCTFTDRRIKCAIDGPDCTMTIVSSCASASAKPGACSRPTPVLTGLLTTQGAAKAGTLMFPLSQPDDPLMLTEMTFATGAQGPSIAGGRLRNNHETAVVHYMLAFAVVRRGSAAVEIVPGGSFDPVMPINPKETRGVSPQPIEIPVAKGDRDAVAVFVYEVRFADRTTWKADIDKVQATVTDLLQQRGSPRTPSKPVL